jgi:hypothetical protein
MASGLVVRWAASVVHSALALFAACYERRAWWAGEVPGLGARSAISVKHLGNASDRALRQLDSRVSELRGPGHRLANARRAYVPGEHHAFGRAVFSAASDSLQKLLSRGSARSPVDARPRFTGRAPLCRHLEFDMASNCKSAEGDPSSAVQWHSRALKLCTSFG